MSHVEQRRKNPQLCAMCRKRAPMSKINPRRNPFSRRAHKGLVVRLKQHDCCRQCWRRLAKFIHHKEVQK